MNTRILAISLIVIGTVLLIFGVNAQVSGVVSGTSNVKAILFIILSIVSLVSGSSMLCRCK